MTIDTIRVFHLQLSKLSFDDVDVVRVSEAFAEDVPETVGCYPKPCIGFAEFLKPPVGGGAIQVGAGIEGLLLSGVVVLFVA